MFKNIFAGRNGIDRYSLFLLIVSLLFFRYAYLWILGVAILGYAVFRTFSKDVETRRKELSRFDEINRKIAGHFIKAFYWVKNLFLRIGRSFTNYRTRLSQRKQYVFVKCPGCKKQLRLPRKKGRLQATCPVCKAEFIKKT